MTKRELQEAVDIIINAYDRPDCSLTEHEYARAGKLLLMNMRRDYGDDNGPS